MFLSHEVKNTILCLCEDTNTPRAVTVAMLLRYEEWDQLVSLRVVPGMYTDPDLFFRDSMVTDLLRKCGGLPTTTDLKKAALDSFWESEHLCYRTNERLAKYEFGNLFSDSERRVDEIISLARKYLSFVLGPCPDVTHDGRFGPGSTFSDRGRLTTVPDKMTSKPTFTGGWARHLPKWSQTAWARLPSAKDLVVVRGNRFTTVPKDSTKDRGIAIEPSLNVYTQLAYGSLMKSRLRRNVRLDLRVAEKKHRQVACDASIRGSLATIDLSSASDTVCKQLVKLLLPTPWFEALDGLRSSHTLLPDGKWVRLEKFSSMGNGFTFELETVVFLSLVFATMAVEGHMPREGENLLVFGDDIIVPSASFESVSAVLSYFGFQLNKRKSFSTGNFRESCGGDFFLGKAVRPFFLEELPDEPHKWIAWANGLRRVVIDHYGPFGGLGRYRTTWFKILDQLPSKIRGCRGPSVLGDLLVHDEESRWRPRERSSIRYFQTWRPARYRWVEWKHFRPEVVLATALYGAGDGTRGVNPRDSVIGYKLGWVPYS